jgi:hypothetical protein
VSLFLAAWQLGSLAAWPPLETSASYVKVYNVVTSVVTYWVQRTSNATPDFLLLVVDLNIVNDLFQDIAKCTRPNVDRRIRQKSTRLGAQRVHLTISPLIHDISTRYRSRTSWTIFAKYVTILDIATTRPSGTAILQSHHVKPRIT